MSSIENKIDLHIVLDENRLPQKLEWETENHRRGVKAFLLSLWDEEEGSLYKIDLWTSKMQKEEMLHFYQQTLITLADTLEKSTACHATAQSLREVAKDVVKNGIQELSQRKATP